MIAQNILSRFFQNSPDG